MSTATIKKKKKQGEVGTFEWALPRHANKRTHCATELVQEVY